MVIIWVLKLGCKMSIFKNVKYKCPFAGKHGTEWIPAVLSAQGSSLHVNWTWMKICL